jgi:type I restriction enzyme M protein
MIKKQSYKRKKTIPIKVREQQILFSEANLLPETLPRLSDLQSTHNLSSIFDECHNYIYANEGLLKDKIFHEIVKLIVMKLYDEQNNIKQSLQFGVTSSEYRNILASKSNSFQPRIEKLFNKVRNKYNSLFSDDSLKLKPLTLAFVIGRLQNISFTNTAGDVKGEAFQSFVYRHQRGDRGEFFTPYPIVKLAVELINPKPGEQIIDPACGSGGFLIQSISYVFQNNINININAYIQQCIRGLEFNPDVALSAMIRLAFEGGSGTEIICTNALLNNEQLNNSFDIVLTNPPFGSKGKIEDQRILKEYMLARRWNKKQNGEWELTSNVLSGSAPEILFIEKSLNLLRPGGRIAIVLPDGLLQNISNSHIRFWIRSQAKILGVVSIPQEAFVPYGTGIKTSLLFLQKLPSNSENVFMARIRKIGYDVKGQPIYKRDGNGKILTTQTKNYIIDDDINEVATAYKIFQSGKFKIENDNIYTIHENLLNTRLDVEYYHPSDQRFISKLKASCAKPLGEISDILNESDDFRLATDEDIRYISISDVDARTMQVVSQQIIKPHEAPSRATYRVREGDIITAISGASTGTKNQATALITKDEDGSICTNGFAVIRNIHGINPLCLLAFMRTQYYLRQVKRLMTGHAIPAISIDDLAKVLVPIPSEEDQKKIAEQIAIILTKRKETLQAGDKVVEETESIVNNMLQ